MIIVEFSTHTPATSTLLHGAGGGAWMVKGEELASLEVDRSSKPLGGGWATSSWASLWECRATRSRLMRRSSRAGALPRGHFGRAVVPTAREAVKGGGGEAAEEGELRADLRGTDGWVESTAAAQMAPATAGKTAAVMAAPMALAVAVTRVVAARAMAVAARAMEVVARARVARAVVAVAVTRVAAARAMAVAARATAVAARAVACVLNMAPRTCYYERRVARGSYLAPQHPAEIVATSQLAVAQAGLATRTAYIWALSLHSFAELRSHVPIVDVQAGDVKHAPLVSTGWFGE